MGARLLAGAMLGLLAVTTAARADDDAEKRKAELAAKRLADQEARDKVHAFHQALKAAKDPEGIVSAVRQVSQTHHLTVLKALAPLCVSPMEYVVQETTQCVVEIAKTLPEKEQMITAKLLMAGLRYEKQRPSVAISACKALGQLGDQTAAPELLKYIETKDTAVCRAAIAALGAIKSRNTIDPLIKCMKKYEYSAVGTGNPNDPSGGMTGQNPGPETLKRMQEIHDPCATALHDITGLSFAGADAWKDWWKANQRTFRLPSERAKDAGDPSKTGN